MANFKAWQSLSEKQERYLLRQVGLLEEGRAEGPRGTAVEADLEAGAVLVGAHDDALPEDGVGDGVSHLEGAVVLCPLLLEIGIQPYGTVGIRLLV